MCKTNDSKAQNNDGMIKTIIICAKTMIAMLKTLIICEKTIIAKLKTMMERSKQSLYVQKQS
jgi:hypothetical protein